VSYNKKKLLCLVGTRPEAIKMAPIILELRNSEWAQPYILSTGQHREMLNQVFETFGLIPDHDLSLMRPNQTLPVVTASLIEAIDGVILAQSPEAMLVQGDTTSAMAGAIAGFYNKLPVGHVEAGLRTGDIYSPFPEEMNRIICGRIAKWHFCPTVNARNLLIKDGVSPDSIFVTGNTVIDSLFKFSTNDVNFLPDIDTKNRVILVTCHRRENFGAPLLDICNSILQIANDNDDVIFLFPVHPNPNVRNIVFSVLGSHPRVLLCDPFEYADFVQAMKKSYLILTDSGGVQEEAPALGKPVLVLRNETERPEAVLEGVAKLVGTNAKNITLEVQALLDNQDLYRAMSKGISPYGDGKAAGRITSILRKELVGACI
jgi:UDP-N-acetylglucosamine 2-epimerase (non-hydrolysing)